MQSTPRLNTNGELVIRKGDSIAMTLTYKDSNGSPIDLTNAEAIIQFKRDILDTVPVISESSNDAQPLIVLGGVLGTIDINIPPSLTELLAFTTGVYGLKIIYDDGVEETILFGNLVVMEKIIT
jgi:hypothetical protein